MNTKLISLPLLMAEETGGGGTLTDEEFINDVPESTPDTDTDTDDADADSTVSDEGEEEPLEESDTEDTDEDELDEEEDKEEEVTDELPHQAATFKNIKEKYPTIFKEFPELEKSFGTAKRYESAFASPEEAQAASQRLELVDIL